MENGALLAEEFSEAEKSAYADSETVVWKDQRIEAGEEKTFLFFAWIKEENVDSVEALGSLWRVNGEKVTGGDNVK